MTQHLAHKDYTIAQDELFLIRKFIEGEPRKSAKALSFCRILIN